MDETMNTTPATAAIPACPVGTWQADPAHSEIAFSVCLLTIGKTRGRFTARDITIVTDEDPRRSSVTATIDLASITTGNDKRDSHLRAAAYLDVDTYPTMSYRSTGIRHTEGGWVVDGEPALHGVTRQVPLTSRRTASPRTSGAGDGRASPRPRQSTGATSASTPVAA